MPTPRTATLAQAAAIVQAKVDTALLTLDEGGDTVAARRNLTQYFSTRRAVTMVGIILADATTETPADVRATFEAEMVTKLQSAIFNLAI